jgi:aspartyl-tRNA(Asn)/glutamyl-tRNA(Gln) amidotransferase subunit B
MRGKEEAHDYRYFPDPDLLPLVIDEEWIAAVRAELPELPAEKRARFEREYGLPAMDAEVLTAGRELADFFEACLDRFPQPKTVSNWVMGPVLGLLNARGLAVEDSPVSAENLADLLKLVDEGTISNKIAKTVFDEMAETGKPAGAIVEEKGLVQVSDAGTLEAEVDAVLAANPDEVAAYKGGKKKLMGFFVGQVMKATRGKANPKLVNEILGRKLGG